MGIPMSSRHYFVIFLFAINAMASTVSNSGGLQVSPVDFDLTLDVEKLTDTSYQDFITKLRSKLAEGAQKSGNVPILPSYGNNPPHLFDVVLLLTTTKRKVIVRCRRDNLYVRGYLMQTPEQWMEFIADGIHMVDSKSKPLAFGADYDSLQGAAGVKITAIKYTQIALKDAVEKLAKSTEKKLQARALIFMAQMISEAARFVDVAPFFGSQLVKGGLLPTWMETLQKDWGKYSTVVQCSDKYGKKYTYKQQTINNVVYNTPEELRRIFGVMLKETKLDDKRTCGIKKLADEEEGEATLILSADI